MQVPAVGKRECQCCHIRDFTALRQGLCAPCEMHQGHTGRALGKRDTEHVAMWKRYCETTLNTQKTTLLRNQETMTRLRQEIDDLNQKLSDAEYSIKSSYMTDSVANWIESTQVAEATQQRDTAYRSRDRIAAILCEIDVLHHSNDGGACSCGKPTSKCEEYLWLTDERDFVYQWQQKQVDRMRKGQDHWLPPTIPREGLGRRLWPQRPDAHQGVRSSHRPA